MSGGKAFACRFCGAPVLWNPGIKRPVNAASRYMAEEAGGLDYGYTTDGRMVRGRFLPSSAGATFVVRDVHCCPQFKSQKWTPPQVAERDKKAAGIEDGDLFGGKGDAR